MDLRHWRTRLWGYGYTSDQYPDVADFLATYAKTVITELCPTAFEPFAGHLDDIEKEQSLFAPLGELSGMGNAFAGWYGTSYERYIDVYKATREQDPGHWERVGQAICDELDQGIHPDDRFLSKEAWLDAGILVDEETWTTIANVLQDAAIDGYCPRHSKYYWSIAESGAPWWDAP